MGFMIWLWLSTIIVLLGGELNAEMEQQAALRDPKVAGGG
jgi:membrane protein